MKSGSNRALPYGWLSTSVVDTGISEESSIYRRGQAVPSKCQATHCSVPKSCVLIYVLQVDGPRVLFCVLTIKQFSF